MQTLIKLQQQALINLKASINHVENNNIINYNK